MPVQNTDHASGLSLADPFALLPADSDLVIRIDFAAMRSSTLFSNHRGMLRDFLVPGFADCGYDPFDDVDSVTAGVPMGAELGVFVVRGLDRDKTLNCLRTSKIETRTDAIFDGDVVALRNKSGNTNLLQFVDARNAVMQGSKGPTRATLAKALQIGAPLRDNKELLAAMAAVQPGTALSLVARPGSNQVAETFGAKVGAPVRGFVITLRATDVVTGRVTVEMADTASAGELVATMDPQLAALRQFLEHYDIHADGATVIVDFAITEAQIKVIANMVAAMAGGGGI